MNIPPPPLSLILVPEAELPLNVQFVTVGEEPKLYIPPPPLSLVPTQA